MAPIDTTAPVVTITCDNDADIWRITSSNGLDADMRLHYDIDQVMAWADRTLDAEHVWRRTDSGFVSVGTVRS